MTAKPLPPHGTEPRYRGTKATPGCRCRRCVTGWTRAGQLRKLAHLEGRPPKIPAAPITRHIQLLLDAGMSLSNIARAARVSRDTVTDHARGAAPTIRRDRAARILAVRPIHIDEHSLVPALATRRRIQALYAAGHGVYVIARHAEGLGPRALDYILNGQRDTVTTATRDAVIAAYRQLADKPSSNPRPRKRAETEGWAGPSYWDDADFDDPGFVPALADDLGRNELAELRRADIEHLARYGCRPEEIHARLGEEVAISTVRAIVREVRTGQRRDRTQAAA